MQHIKITTTTMGFHIGVTKRGELKGSSLNIMTYARQFENRQYDRALNKVVLLNEFFYFSEQAELCFFPKFALSTFIEFLDLHGVAHSITRKPGEVGAPTEFHMLPFVEYKNDAQKGCVEYLTDSKNGPVRGVGLQTGTGKTTSYIWAVQKLGVRCMTVMTSRLNQWVNEINTFTTLDESDIYLISGVASLTKLFNQIDTLNPKFILGSSKTIRNYLEYGPAYQHLPHPSEMCEKLGIGIVGTDEFHEHFYTNFLIGIVLNPALFIPITATFIANDPFVKKIFDQFIPKSQQFTGGDYEKYVNVTAYQYQGGGYLLKPFNYMSPRGYSQQIFEKFLVTRGRKVLDPLVHDALIPIIRNHYINVADPGEKFLFLCSSTRLCDHLVNVFRLAFPNKTVTAFYSGIPESVLKEYDMILSTPGSSGTGRDIKGLRTCLIFESVESETRNTQFIGRLRKLPSNTPEFVYISFKSIPSHVKVHNVRSALYGNRALTFHHRTIG